jgi:hypothetical protein
LVGINNDTIVDALHKLRGYDGLDGLTPGTELWSFFLGKAQNFFHGT